MFTLYEFINIFGKMNFQAYSCTVDRIIFVLIVVYRTLIYLDGQNELYDIKKKWYFTTKQLVLRHLCDWFLIRFQLTDYVFNQKVYKYCILFFLDQIFLYKINQDVKGWTKIIIFQHQLILSQQQVVHYVYNENFLDKDV